MLAASCKEEIALLVLMMGLYAVLALRRVAPGRDHLALAAGWALLAVPGDPDIFAVGNIHWGRYAIWAIRARRKVVALLTRPD